MPLAVDISEAAELTGLSKKALRRRIERGTLPAVKRGNVRRIPVAELERAGLLEGASRARWGHGGNGGTPEGKESVATDSTGLSAADLLREVSRLSEEVGRHKAIAARAESLERAADAERDARERAEQEVHQLRAELEAARSARPRWPWSRA